MPDLHESGSITERDGDRIYNPHEYYEVQRIMYTLNCEDLYGRQRATSARPTHARAPLAERLSPRQRLALVRFAHNLHQRSAG